MRINKKERLQTAVDKLEDTYDKVSDDLYSLIQNNNISKSYIAKDIDIFKNQLQRVLKENGYMHNELDKQQTKINKYAKENEELKEERQIVGIPVRNKRDGRIGIVLHQWKGGSVVVLESINPRVINTHDSWNTLEIVTD